MERTILLGRRSAMALVVGVMLTSAVAVTHDMRAEAASLPLAGAWVAEDIGGGGVIDNLQTTLEISADGKVSGSGGCNRFTGSATIEGNSIKFGDLASTMMACEEAAMDQEVKFHDALEATRAFSVDAEQRKLFLTDEAGKVLVQFSAK